jgi:hypothetical protein
MWGFVASGGRFGSVRIMCRLWQGSRPVCMVRGLFRMYSGVRVRLWVIIGKLCSLCINVQGSLCINVEGKFLYVCGDVWC